MPNIQRKISTRNEKVIQTETSLEEEVPRCNCRDFPCPLYGNCRSTKSVVYKASVLNENGNIETYTGLMKILLKKDTMVIELALQTETTNMKQLSLLIFEK